MFLLSLLTSVSSSMDAAGFWHGGMRAASLAGPHDRVHAAEYSGTVGREVV